MPKYTPPAALESEQTILGIILLYPGKLQEIIEIIRPEDFYRTDHAIIYQGMLNLLEAEIPIDLVTLSSHLREKGQLAAAGGKKFFAALSNEVGPSHNFKHHVQVVHDKSTLRRLLAAALTIAKDCQNGGRGNTLEIVEKAHAKVLEIKEGAGDPGKKSLSARVREWVLTEPGLILTEHVHKNLELTERGLKKQANDVLRRMVEEGKLTPCGDRRGCYRVIEESLEIDWQAADVENIYQIAWPFELEKLVTLYPGNIVVLAGAQNVGKSAFLYNLIKLNQQTHKIVYFNSESGPEEMKVRLSKFEDIGIKDWRFLAKERSTNFADAIFPNRLNLIDYLEITDNFYQIGGELKKIHDRLKKGIAVIALQKKTGAELGRGAEFALEKPRLYLSMDPGKLKIVKGKNWANPEINPNGMIFSFKLIQGAKFLEWE